MLHVVLAALQITWSGAGYPKNAKGVVPVVVAKPYSVRVSRTPIAVRALDAGSVVPAEWSVSPQYAINLDAEPDETSMPEAAAYIAPTDYRGPATLHATYGSLTASLPAFVYGSAALGCYMSFSNGLRFDEDGVARPSGTPRDSDVFETGLANQPRMSPLQGCTGAFIASRGFTVHVPYGGTVLRYKSGAYFGDVRVGNWHDDFTIVPALHDGDILVFRTHDGRLAKLLVDSPDSGVISGPYLVGPYKGGEFWDYLTYHPVKKPSHAIFGRH